MVPRFFVIKGAAMRADAHYLTTPRLMGNFIFGTWKYNVTWILMGSLVKFTHTNLYTDTYTTIP